MAYYSDKSEIFAPYKKVLVLINPTLEQKTYNLDEYFQLFVDPAQKGDAIIMKNGIIPPLRIQVLYAK